uniref:G_PROTEIN_RECEP_F1_2 domain-containing protein n=1 Tax=Loa loa TaxID=7209 RepID=A0A1I7W3W4_LOALO
MSTVTILFLAIDRFIAVQSPLKYRTARTIPYIALAIVTGFAYSTAFVIAGFIVADDELVEPCDQTMAYSTDLMTVWNYGSVSIAVAVFIINVIDYYLLRKTWKRSEHDHAAYRRQNQLTSSMLITMVANCLTSLLSAFTLFIVNFLPISADVIEGFQQLQRSANGSNDDKASKISLTPAESLTFVQDILISV